MVDFPPPPAPTVWYEIHCPQGILVTLDPHQHLYCKHNINLFNRCRKCERGVINPRHRHTFDHVIDRPAHWDKGHYWPKNNLIHGLLWCSQCGAKRKPRKGERTSHLPKA